MEIQPFDEQHHEGPSRSESINRSACSQSRQLSASLARNVTRLIDAWEPYLNSDRRTVKLSRRRSISISSATNSQTGNGSLGAGGSGATSGANSGAADIAAGSSRFGSGSGSDDAVARNGTAAEGGPVNGNPQHGQPAAVLNRTEILNSSGSSSSLSRESSAEGSDDDGTFSDAINAWEAELDAKEAGLSKLEAQGTSSTNKNTTGNKARLSEGASGSGGTAISTSRDHPSHRTGSNRAIVPGTTAMVISGPSCRGQGQAQSTAPLPTAAVPRRRTTTCEPRSSCASASQQRRPMTAGAGGGGGGRGGTRRCGFTGADSSQGAATRAPLSARGLPSHSTTRGGEGSINHGIASAATQRRRAAFVAGGSSSLSQRKVAGAAAISGGKPGRDILLPRLPAPALDIIVPALPSATRAALRCTCKALRTLVDNHTHSLTMRPDRRVFDELSARGTKVSALFPALRHATVILAGSCSGATGPDAAGGPHPAPAAAGSGGSGGGGGSARRRASAASTSASPLTSSPKTAAEVAAAAASPLLSLGGWLLNSGVARGLTTLTMHLGEIALVQDLALCINYPHLQRLELFIGLSGNPHASPPLIQFIVGVLRDLRHFSMTWAGGPDGAGAGSNSAAGAARVPSLASLAHGPRRLFLDGRPRIGRALLATLTGLRRLESLELRGFLIDTDAYVMFAHHWPELAPRLRRLVLSKLHLMVPNSTPPEQQLGELIASCVQLQDLHVDLCLPTSAGAPGLGAVAGPGAAAAAALIISLMYASRDVKAMRPEMLPTSLTRLSLPGVCLTAPDELAALSRLRNLTSLELAALGSGAGEHLPALQELRLKECYWRQLLDMLPWRQPQQVASPAAAQEQQPAAQNSASCQEREQQHAEQGPWPQGLSGVERGSGIVAGGAAADGMSDVGNAAPGHPLQLAASGTTTTAAAAISGPAQPADAVAALRAAAGALRRCPRLVMCSSSSGDGGGGAPLACGQLRVLEVVVCERLDDWEASDRGLLARVGKGLLPLADTGCRLRLKVAEDAQPKIWNESDKDGKPWEPAAVWRHIKAAQNLRRLQAETKALTERLARGRVLQATRIKEKQLQFVER